MRAKTHASGDVWNYQSDKSNEAGSGNSRSSQESSDQENPAP
jgi:hypothetical protein